MCSANSRWHDSLASTLKSVGVAHFSVAAASAVEESGRVRFDEWVASGKSAGMDYLKKYDAERNDLRLLLPGAQSIVCCAFPYWHPDSLQTDIFAAYALADDYHEVVRRRLTAAAEAIARIVGGEWRVCVDTAPLREQYWAARSGLGVKGLNGQLIIPGEGSYFFLGEILTTARLEPYAPCRVADCGRCGRCVKACPTGALDADGQVDARRCISYLTIEHRGDFPEGTDLHGHLYGCDECGRACPHNRVPIPTDIPEFTPRRDVVGLTVERAAEMTQEEFSGVFRRSAVKRAKLAGLRRNAISILDSRRKK